MTAPPQDEPSPFDPPALPDTWQLVPVCWANLDRATAAHQWAALGDWVRWLATRYTLATRTIPPCWYRHGGIVEELSALRTGWLAASYPTHGSALPWTGTTVSTAPAPDFTKQPEVTAAPETTIAMTT